MAPRTPYATDEPESFYETPNHPQRRIRQPAPVNANQTNLYDNYSNDPSANRQSGIGALGAGFMNGSLDDDDDEPEEKEKYNPFTSAKEKEASKHAMLAAATGARKTPTPPPQYIASPRPGYAAPIEALSRPQPAAVPASRQPPAGLQINTSAPTNPFQTPMERNMYSNSPQPIGVPSTPHPLQPPMTPITPIFARPRNNELRFDEKPIMRGAGEGTSIPTRGEKGDDFWRRFSMVVKEERSKPAQQKQSSWLKNTQGRTSAMSRWVFIIGLVLLICAVGAIGLGWYVAHNSTTHSQPSAIGGSAQESGVAGSSSAVGSASSGAKTAATSLHVSPTNTVARRIVVQAQPTGLAYNKHKRHLNRTSH